VPPRITLNSTRSVLAAKTGRSSGTVMSDSSGCFGISKDPRLRLIGSTAAMDAGFADIVTVSSAGRIRGDAAHAHAACGRSRGSENCAASSRVLSAMGTGVDVLSPCAVRVVSPVRTTKVAAAGCRHGLTGTKWFGVNGRLSSREIELFKTIDEFLL